MVSWLEEPINLRRTQKGSGEKKSSWLKSIATRIPTRTESQVTYKFDNLKRAHRDTVRLANSSGWGLDERSLRNSESSIRGKRYIIYVHCQMISIVLKELIFWEYFKIVVLEKKCPFFFRLEEVWGSRPNVRPPISFDSGGSFQEKTAAASTLISVLERSKDSVSGSPNLTETNRSLIYSNADFPVRKIPIVYAYSLYINEID